MSCFLRCFWKYYVLYHRLLSVLFAYYTKTKSRIAVLCQYQPYSSVILNCHKFTVLTLDAWSVLSLSFTGGLRITPI
jgi:hypothetical protein